MLNTDGMERVELVIVNDPELALSGGLAMNLWSQLTLTDREWQPPNSSFHCDYTVTYIEVSDAWNLALKPIDVDYAEELLPAC